MPRSSFDPAAALALRQAPLHRARAQQQAHHLGVARLTRNEKWRDTMFLGLVHVEAEALVSKQGIHGAGVAFVAGLPERVCHVLFASLRDI